MSDFINSGWTVPQIIKISKSGKDDAMCSRNPFPFPPDTQLELCISLFLAVG